LAHSSSFWHGRQVRLLESQIGSNWLVQSFETQQTSQRSRLGQKFGLSAGQPHEPPMHGTKGSQALPHLPQLSGSFCRFSQPVEQQVSPRSHGSPLLVSQTHSLRSQSGALGNWAQPPSLQQTPSKQLPPQQTSPTLQGLLSSSQATQTLLPLQTGVGFWQPASSQHSPVRHEPLQQMQSARSGQLAAVTQGPPHVTGTHVPMTHSSPGGQWLLLQHSRQSPPQQLRALAGQRLPHSPQLLRLVLRLTQPVAQQVWLAAHVCASPALGPAVGQQLPTWQAPSQQISPPLH
jgi:hypothetical protein